MENVQAFGKAGAVVRVNREIKRTEHDSAIAIKPEGSVPRVRYRKSEASERMHQTCLVVTSPWNHCTQALPPPLHGRFPLSLREGAVVWVRCSWPAVRIGRESHILQHGLQVFGRSFDGCECTVAFPKTPLPSHVVICVQARGMCDR